MKLKNKKYQNSNFFKLRIPFIRNKYKMNGGGYVSHLLLFSFFLLELAYGKGTSSSSSSSSSSSASSSLNYDNSFSLSGNTGGLSSLQYEHQQIMPKIMTRGQSYRPVIGDTIVLPCRVEDLGDNTLLWRRGNSVLTADKTMITKNQRYKLVDKYDLQIKIVEPQDAGDYNCQINDQENRDFVHTVEILVPPKVWSIPENGHVTARKGGTVSLECKASGNPVPSIRWTKKDPADEHRYIAEGSTITLDRVERQNSGTYQCIAENGVREPATARVVLTVLSPPEITVDKSWVHAGEGYEARLVCTVYGEANPMMTWYQDSFLLETTDRRIMDVKDNQHTLLIRNVQSSDFGNYSCVADNSLGRAKKYIEVSGRPAAAVFHSPLYSRTRDSYNLTWSIESAPSLEEIRLLYRKLMMNETYQHPGKWHDIILTPDVKSTDSVHHKMTYTIRGLEQNSVYEAIVQAKNRYGWNEVSDIFQFYIQSSTLNNNHLEMEEQDMESLLHSTQYNSAKNLIQTNSFTIILSISLLHSVFIIINI